jgi:glycosyltransferase involved in cell wall biosynthesis
MTLHDYTLVCPSGGQRVHQAEEHICTLIDPRRCSRCFPQHNFYERSRFGPLATERLKFARRFSRAAERVRRRTPVMVELVTRAMGGRISPERMEERLQDVQRIFASTDLFVSPSPNLAAEYRRLGLPPEKLRVLDYGFIRWRASRSEPSARLRIGFVGTLVWHKGAHILLEAVRSLPANCFELLVFGDMNTFPHYTSALREQARGLPVRFLGRFEQDHIPDIYARFDVLVVPSLWPENSPLVIHEAFMAGIPVVGSRQGGTQDLIAHDVNGLLYDAFSPTALANALQSFIKEPGLLARFAAAVPEVKSIHQNAIEFVGIYQELLGKTDPPVFDAGVPTATL